MSPACTAKYLTDTCDQGSDDRTDPRQGQSGFQGAKPDLLVEIIANPLPDRQRSIGKEAITERVGRSRKLARKANARGEP